jgi:hypothetical protein
MRIIRICTETIAGSQIGPSIRHDLHQAHGAFGRQGERITKTLHPHDGANPDEEIANRCDAFLTKSPMRSAVTVTALAFDG